MLWLRLLDELFTCRPLLYRAKFNTNPKLIRTATAAKCPVLIPRSTSYGKPPNVSGIRLLRTLIALFPFLRGYLTLTSTKQSNRLVATWFPPLLSDKAGGWESQSIKLESLSIYRAEVTIPPMPRPATTEEEPALSFMYSVLSCQLVAFAVLGRLKSGRLRPARPSA